MNGIINFFKPKGMSSHGAVNFLRRKLGIKRIGHTGTLDPEVAGVLPLCIGKATRVSEYLLEADKEYIGELTLGMETESQDSEGNVVNFSDKIVTNEDILEVFNKYIGEIKQVPPMYSALKYNGEALYKLAREGKTVERKARISYIEELEILDIVNNKNIIFRVKCSKGTYIRTLCHDIGRELGTYGYMSYLIRTSVEDFKIEDALGMDTIEELSLSELEKFIIPMDYGVKNLPKIIVDDENFKALSHGSMVKLNKIENDEYYMEDKEYRIYSNGIFIGIGLLEKNKNSYYIKMRKVLLT